MTLSKTLEMDAYLTKHEAIMDKYDPEKKIGLIVDEWGNWHDVEPGTNPGFLYQQNTLRDALVAGINLNIFNNQIIINFLYLFSTSRHSEYGVSQEQKRTLTFLI